MEKQKYTCFILLMFVCTVLLFLEQTDPAIRYCAAEAELTADNVFGWNEDECDVCPVFRNRKSVLSPLGGKIYVPVSAPSLKSTDYFSVTRVYSLPPSRAVLCIYRI